MCEKCESERDDYADFNSSPSYIRLLEIYKKRHGDSYEEWHKHV